MAACNAPTSACNRPEFAASASSAIQGECSKTPPKRAMKSSASRSRARFFELSGDICTLSPIASTIKATVFDGVWTFAKVLKLFPAVAYRRPGQFSETFIKQAQQTDNKSKTKASKERRIVATAENRDSAGRLTTHVLDTMHGKPAA